MTGKSLTHVLEIGLALITPQHYYLHEQTHSYQLPDHTSTLEDKNYLIRMLYKDLNLLAVTLTFLFFVLYQQRFVCCAIKTVYYYYYYYYYYSKN